MSGLVRDPLEGDLVSPAEFAARVVRRATRDARRRKFWSDEEWHDVTPYLGELHNFSAKFASSTGPQVVCGGDELREDGRARRWAFVSGEIHHR